MKRTLFYQLFVILLLSFAFVACERQDRDDTIDERGDDTYSPETGTEMRTETEEDYIFFDDSRDYTFEERDRFNQDIQQAREKVNQEISTLETQIQNVAADQREEYKEKINDLKSKRDELDKEMKAFSRVTADNWDEFQNDVTSAFNDVEDSYKDLKDDIYDEIHDEADDNR